MTDAFKAYAKEWDQQERRHVGRLAFSEKPWLEQTVGGEDPGDICCKIAQDEFCYEHTEGNWRKGPNGKWLLKLFKGAGDDS